MRPLESDDDDRTPCKTRRSKSSVQRNVLCSAYREVSLY